jgi:hypothetical protein
MQDGFKKCANRLGFNSLPSPNGKGTLNMINVKKLGRPGWRHWENIMKYAAGLDSLSGVKYHPWDVVQWAKVGDQKAHNQCHSLKGGGRLRRYYYRANLKPIA